MNILYKNKLTAEAIPQTRRQNIPRQRPQNKPVKKRQPVTVPLSVKLKCTGVAFCGFALAIATVAHFAFISQLNSEITTMENNLDKIQNQNSQLEMKTVELRSAQRLEQYAKEELDMKRSSDLKLDYSDSEEMY